MQHQNQMTKKRKRYSMEFKTKAIMKYKENESQMDVNNQEIENKPKSKRGRKPGSKSKKTIENEKRIRNDTNLNIKQQKIEKLNQEIIELEKN
ncbi:hypothetical protein BpHYR1_005389 [Brachionus plicatilis]|uniref:Uncharacterized protein n=1 Tax=Brachionus plicatilis TaxID=10195 RepID=A0A3M7R0F0_BRAPC|nr:hypothetical protein BpHYR1_005389 [Brachionus plicatilis]